MLCLLLPAPDSLVNKEAQQLTLLTFPQGSLRAPSSQVPGSQSAFSPVEVYGLPSADILSTAIYKMPSLKLSREQILIGLNDMLTRQKHSFAAFFVLCDQTAAELSLTTRQKDTTKRLSDIAPATA